MDLQINSDNFEEDNKKSQPQDQQRVPSISNLATKPDVDPTM